MLPRMVVALFSALTLLAFGASTAFATATPPECTVNGRPYPSEPYPTENYWYAQIDANASSGPLATEGVRGQLTTNGSPSTSDPNSQHVALYVGAHEGSTAGQLQVGWIIGQFGECYGNQTSTGTTINVYVEIHDDTGSQSNCYASLFEPAPWGASYEVTYAGRDGTYYQYRTYYQGPGEQIQYLGWGDYNSLYLSPSAVGEVLSPLINPGTPNATPRACPVLGRNASGWWNELGYPPSSTFASVLQIYNGSSWVNWPSGSPLTTTETADLPYKLATPTPYTYLWNTGGQP